MSNEYKDWLRDIEEDNHIIAEKLHTGAVCGLDIEQVMHFIDNINRFNINTLYIQQSADSNYILKVDDLTLKGWDENDQF